MSKKLMCRLIAIAGAASVAHMCFIIAYAAADGYDVNGNWIWPDATSLAATTAVTFFTALGLGFVRFGKLLPAAIFNGAFVGCIILGLLFACIISFFIVSGNLDRYWDHDTDHVNLISVLSLFYVVFFTVFVPALYFVFPLLAALSWRMGGWRTARRIAR